MLQLMKGHTCFGCFKSKHVIIALGENLSCALGTWWVSLKWLPLSMKTAQGQKGGMPQQQPPTSSITLPPSDVSMGVLLCSYLDRHVRDKRKQIYCSIIFFYRWENGRTPWHQWHSFSPADKIMNERGSTRTLVHTHAHSHTHNSIDPSMTRVGNENPHTQQH